MHICLFLRRLNLHRSFFDISLWTLALETMLSFIWRRSMRKKKTDKKKAWFSISLGSFSFKRFHCTKMKRIFQETQKVLTCTINNNNKLLFSQKSFRTRYIKDIIFFFQKFSMEKLPKNSSCVWVCALNSVANKNLLL